MKKTFLLLSVMLLSFVFIASCKKDKTTSTDSSLLQSGRWNAVSMSLLNNITRIPRGEFTAVFTASELTLTMNSVETGEFGISTKYTLSGKNMTTEKSIIPTALMGGWLPDIKEFTIDKLTKDSLILKTKIPLSEVPTDIPMPPGFVAFMTIRFAH